MSYTLPPPIRATDCFQHDCRDAPTMMWASFTVVAMGHLQVIKTTGLVELFLTSIL